MSDAGERADGTERSVPERPPCEEVAHMSDTTDGNHVDLERRVCPNCRLYFDTGQDSGQVFCGTACMLDYDGAELRADGGEPADGVEHCRACGELQEWIDNVPPQASRVSFACPGCGWHQTVELDGREAGDSR